MRDEITRAGSRRFGYIAAGLPILFLIARWYPAPAQETFRFAILGDRTGEAQPGIYERILQKAMDGRPAFVLSTGDTIEGLQDAGAAAEWQQWARLTAPFGKVPFYLTPGNHDIWSAASLKLFERFAGHPAHYSFDSGPVHVTVLDNSGTDHLLSAELEFLEQDLKANASRPIKMIVSHRPSWILYALIHDNQFALHRLARRYGVQYVIACHVHQMLHYNLDGVNYVSMVSSGGHLRSSGKYEDGWFFGYATVGILGNMVTFEIRDLNGRVTSLDDWGAAGLLKRPN